MITFFGVLYFHQLLHHIPCSVIIRLQYRQLSCNAVYSNQINIVTVVELGDICTGFTKARQKSILGDDEYGGRISRSVSQMEHDEQNGIDPADIGRYIAGIVEKKKPAVVYVAGAQYKFLSLLCKLLPAAARGKIVGKIYG